VTERFDDPLRIRRAVSVETASSRFESGTSQTVRHETCAGKRHDAASTMDSLRLYIHDVKNDLAWLSGRAEELGERDMQRVALEAAERLPLLLPWLRQERGELCITPDAAHPADLLEELAANQRLLYPQEVMVDARTAPDLWFYDSHLLRLALRIALSNAARFARQRIRLSAVENGDFLEWIVHDDGPGFGEAVLSGRTLTTDTHTGSGYGLALARAIAQGHENQGRRGYLSLSNDGGGVFRMGLPR
jgi:signal transduction histidine kinase